MLLERLARPLLRDLRNVCQYRVQIAELPDQFLRTLFADARYARHIVRRVADQRKKIGRAVRWHTEPFAAILHPHPVFIHTGRSTATRVQQPDARTHQLMKILVAGNDDHVQPRLDALTCERSDHVIGLEAVQRQDRRVVGREQRMHMLEPEIEVGLQIHRQLLARRLVVGIHLVAKRRAGVVNPAEVFRLVPLHEAVEKIRDAPRDRRVHAMTRLQRTVDQGVEGAINQRVAVHQEEAWGRGFGLDWRGHARNLASEPRRPIASPVTCVPRSITRNRPQLIVVTRRGAESCRKPCSDAAVRSGAQQRQQRGGGQCHRAGHAHVVVQGDVGAFHSGRDHADADGNRPRERSQPPRAESGRERTDHAARERLAAATMSSTPRTTGNGRHPIPDGTSPRGRDCGIERCREAGDGEGRKQPGRAGDAICRFMWSKHHTDRRIKM